MTSLMSVWRIGLHRWAWCGWIECNWFYDQVSFILEWCSLPLQLSWAGRKSLLTFFHPPSILIHTKDIHWSRHAHKFTPSMNKASLTPIFATHLTAVLFASILHPLTHSLGPRLVLTLPSSVLWMQSVYFHPVKVRLWGGREREREKKSRTVLSAFDRSDCFCFIRNTASQVERVFYSWLVRDGSKCNFFFPFTSSFFFYVDFLSLSLTFTFSFSLFLGQGRVSQYFLPPIWFMKLVLFFTFERTKIRWTFGKTFLL